VAEELWSLIAQYCGVKYSDICLVVRGRALHFPPYLCPRFVASSSYKSTGSKGETNLEERKWSGGLEGPDTTSLTKDPPVVWPH
jgi:hypothetical protein